MNRAYRLETEERPGEGLRRIALGRAEKALEELRRAGREADPSDPIHEARKDLKKLRAVVRLVRDELGDDLYREENHRYRDAGRRLSSARDAEVKLETLDALGGRLGGELAAGAVGEWREALERERQVAIEAVRDGERASLKEAIEAGRERIRDWPLSTDSWALVDAGLTGAYRRGRRAMRRTAADPSAENVHEWRKRTKDLRYQLRLLCNAWPQLLEAAEEQSHELSDLLGEHHDLAVLREDLARRELGAADRMGLEGAIVGRQGELAGRAVDLGRRLYAEKPKAFRRRIRAYWRAWRRPGSSPISS